MDVYINKAKAIAHQLAIASKPVDEDDLILQILRGLPSEYLYFNVSMETRKDSVSLNELHGFLLIQEANLKEDDSQTFESIMPAANIASKQVYNKQTNYRGRSRNNYQSRGGVRKSEQYKGDRLVCQICGKVGHIAKFCSSYTNLLKEKEITSPQAYHAVSSSTLNQDIGYNNWYLDSGATHHITNDINNLSIHAKYKGGDAVKIGDGSGLRIVHIGSSKTSQNLV
uniref:Retrovirus-related Pol polyprotein from transposon TNT 1-94-like beta-barrel domain-containing protein n=1 Tax=Nymphaea colorata TaxID=210225 RepID=A0A5K1BAT7_9MAGN